MARELPNVGTVSYNGFTFPEAFEAEVTATPIRDTSGRTIKYVRHSITIRALIVPDDAPKSTAGAPVDSNLENIRCRLEKSGGSFVFIGQGFGNDFVVNSSTPYTNPESGSTVSSIKIDPTFGPHPTILVWKPVGSNRAVQLVWTCEVTIPSCCGTGTINYRTPLEFAYTISWDIADNGRSTRTIQGNYEMPGFRRNALAGSTNGQVAETADSYWDTLYQKILPIPGFMRTHRRSLASDHRTMNFTVTDKEIPSPNAFHPYMVTMDIRHRMNVRFPELMKVNNTMSGTIRVAPTAPRVFAWIAFAQVVSNRLNAAELVTYKKEDGKEHKGFPFIMGMSFEENIYDDSLDFSVDWWFLSSIKDIFRGSDFFNPVRQVAKKGQGLPQDISKNENVTWENWQQSMTIASFSPRGSAGLGASAQDDFLLNICENQEPPRINSINTKKINTLPLTYSPQADSPPPKDQSYMHYESDLQHQKSTHKVRHRSAKIQNNQTVLMRGNERDDGYLVNLIDEPNDESHIDQVRGPSTNQFILSGKGIRVGYPVPIPFITSVGDAKALVKDVVSKQIIVGYGVGGWPIYAAAWEIYLDLTKTPTNDIVTNSATSSKPQDKM